MITSFIGVIGSGKDHRAIELEKHGFVRIDFKDSLVELASDIAGYDIKEDYEWFKTNIVGVKRPGNQFAEGFIHADLRALATENPDLMTGRRLLQRLGTEGMRKRDPEYWVNRFVDKVIKVGAVNIVNADCRFMNEVERLSRVKAKFIFCDYHSSRYDATSKHESERLAQSLLQLGLKDGQEITAEHFELATCPF
jgi:hypothetical protein